MRIKNQSKVLIPGIGELQVIPLTLGGAHPHCCEKKDRTA